MNIVMEKTHTHTHTIATEKKRQVNTKAQKAGHWFSIDRDQEKMETQRKTLVIGKKAHKDEHRKSIHTQIYIHIV